VSCFFPPGCKVTPECYGHLTHFLTSLANGKVILALEGGYNIDAVSYCMTMCTKALLGDPLPPLKLNFPICKNAQKTMKRVLSVQKKYWSCLSIITMKGQVNHSLNDL